jgi:hypothetical protein
MGRSAWGRRWAGGLTVVVVILLAVSVRPTAWADSTSVVLLGTVTDVVHTHPPTSGFFPFDAASFLDGTAPGCPPELGCGAPPYPDFRFDHEVTATAAVAPDGTIAYQATLAIDLPALAATHLQANFDPDTWSQAPPFFQELVLDDVELRFRAPAAVPSGAATIPVEAPSVTSDAAPASASIDGNEIVVSIPSMAGGFYQNASPTSPLVDTSPTLDIAFELAATGAQHGDTIVLGHPTASYQITTTIGSPGDGLAPPDHSTATGRVDDWFDPFDLPATSTSVVGPTGIGGTVRSGGGPSDAVRVGLYPAVGDGRLATATTGPDGSFAFVPLAPGSYRLRAFDPAGLLRGEWNLDASTAGTATPVTVSTGSVSTVEFDLDPVSDLHGSVFDHATSAPVAGAVVTAHHAAGGMAAATTTAVDGSYHFSQLAPGPYKLKFAAVGHVTEWFEDAPSAATSVNIDAIAGAPTAVADVSLGPEGSFALSGTVTDAGSGLPLTGATARLYTSSGFVSAASVGVDGTYGFAVVKPVTPYFVRFQAPGYTQDWWNGAGSSFGGAQSLAYDGIHPITGVDASLRP